MKNLELPEWVKFVIEAVEKKKRQRGGKDAEAEPL